jgi:hypothetical protein
LVLVVLGVLLNKLVVLVSIQFLEQLLQLVAVVVDTAELA